MLKLKLQYFGHLMQRANSLEKTLMLGSIEGRRRRGRQRMRQLDGCDLTALRVRDSPGGAAALSSGNLCGIHLLCNIWTNLLKSLFLSVPLWRAL